jgi:hypothetical protein
MTLPALVTARGRELSDDTVIVETCRAHCVPEALFAVIRLQCGII